MELTLSALQERVLAAYRPLMTAAWTMFLLPLPF